MSDRDWLAENGYEDSIVFSDPDYEGALIGVSTDGRAIYSYDKMVQSLSNNSYMSYEESADFIDYNAIRSLSYVGASSPIIMYEKENEIDETD